MIKHIKRTVTVSLLFMLMVAMPTPALAYSVFAGACSADSSGTSQSDACQNNKPPDNPLTGTTGHLYKISMILAMVAGIAAVIVIIISGFRMVQSGGDAQKVANARTTLIGALIGLVIIIAAQSILVFVLNRI